MIGRRLPKLGATPRSGLRISRMPKGAYRPRLGAARRDILEAIAGPGPGTLPERLVRKALLANGLPFTEQYSVNNGRFSLGGAIVDFLLPLGALKGTVVRVQGAYWHRRKAKSARDAIQEIQLKSDGYRVVDLWEDDIENHTIMGDLYRWILLQLYTR